MIFSVAIHGCESWTIKKAEHQRTDAFELWCWSFSFSIIHSKEIPGLISFRKDLLDLLEVQKTLKSLLQHHSSKASILQRSAFFTVQISHPCMTTGKTIAFTRRMFVGKVICMWLFFDNKYNSTTPSVVV